MVSPNSAFLKIYDKHIVTVKNAHHCIAAHNNNHKWSQGYISTQIWGHRPIKIVEVMNISKLQDNYSIYRCEFHMPLIYVGSNALLQNLASKNPGSLKY